MTPADHFRVVAPKYALEVVRPGVVDSITPVSSLQHDIRHSSD